MTRRFGSSLMSIRKNYYCKVHHRTSARGRMYGEALKLVIFVVVFVAVAVVTETELGAFTLSYSLNSFNYFSLYFCFFFPTQAGAYTTEPFFFFFF